MWIKSVFYRMSARQIHKLKNGVIMKNGEIEMLYSNSISDVFVGNNFFVRQIDSGNKIKGQLTIIK